jgi:hypothetical protein
MKQLKTRPHDGMQSDFEDAAKLITQLKQGYAVGSNERRLLLLMKDASFFIYLYHKKQFSEFLQCASNGLTVDQLKKLEKMGIVVDDD